MKFVCDHCKAKYQIADEKVAGKTVRMKCRKCGNMVEVRSAVTETSVATGEVEEAHDPPAGTPASGARTAAAAPAGASPKPPVAKPAPPKPPLATPLASVRPLGTKSSDKTPAPLAPSAPMAKPPVPGLSPSKPAVPKVGGGPLAAVRGGPAAAQPAEAPDALANAFERALEEEPAADDNVRDSMADAAGDEWYAAINGVPVGPIRLGELRRKAALGNVNEDSLVWQEGMEEWRPVKAIPELAELVREAIAVGRPSLLPPDGRTSVTGSGRAVPRTGAAPPAMKSGGFFPKTSTPPPGQGPKGTEENTVMVPFAMLKPRASEEDLLNAPAAPAVVADPFAGAGVDDAKITNQLDPFASPALAPKEPSLFPGGAPDAGRMTIEGPTGLPQPSKRKGSIAPILMAVAAVGFGFVLAAVVYGGKSSAPAPQPETIVIYSSVPVAGPAPVASEAASSPSAVAAGKRPAGGGAPAAAKPAASSGVDLGGLLGRSGGPALPNVGGPGPSAGTGNLTQDQIEGVVAARRASVKRACLDRADPSLSNVKVTVRATVGANGQVQNATATGNEPSVARCVENNVKTWVFPPSGGTSTVELPFTLVRQ